MVMMVIMQIVCVDNRIDNEDDSGDDNRRRSLLINLVDDTLPHVI